MERHKRGFKNARRRYHHARQLARVEKCEDDMVFVWKAVAGASDAAFDDKKYYGTTKYFHENPEKHRGALHWNYAWAIERIKIRVDDPILLQLEKGMDYDWQDLGVWEYGQDGTPREPYLK
jgi:hypothetical protein